MFIYPFVLLQCFGVAVSIVSSPVHPERVKHLERISDCGSGFYCSDGSNCHLKVAQTYTFSIEDVLCTIGYMLRSCVL